MELTDQEAAAIRWHMGAYRDRECFNEMSRAFDRYPLALFLHLADMTAAHWDEVLGRDREKLHIVEHPQDLGRRYPVRQETDGNSEMCAQLQHQYRETRRLPAARCHV